MTTVVPLPDGIHTEAFESSETEEENYCLLRAEILLSISDLGVRYLFRSGLTSPLLVRGPHYTHVYLLHQRPVIGGGFDSHRLRQVIARLAAPMGTSAHPFCFSLLLLLIWSHKPVRSSVLTPI